MKSKSMHLYASIYQEFSKSPGTEKLQIFFLPVVFYSRISAAKHLFQS